MSCEKCYECEKCFACEVQCGQCFTCQSCVACERGFVGQAPMQRPPQPVQRAPMRIQRPMQRPPMPLTEERVKEIMVDMLTELGLIRKPEKKREMNLE